MEQQAAVGGGGSGQANLKPIKQEKKNYKNGSRQSTLPINRPKKQRRKRH